MSTAATATVIRRFSAVNGNVVNTATGRIVKAWGDNRKAVSDAARRNLNDRFGVL